MRLRSGLFVILILTVCVSASSMGCKKSGSADAELELVAVPPFGLNADGTITPDALRKIAEQDSKGKGFVVGFSHATLSDGGLNQLAKFKNLRRVIAENSRVTPAGIENLKKAVPGVEIVK